MRSLLWWLVGKFGVVPEIILPTPANRIFRVQVESRDFAVAESRIFKVPSETRSYIV